MKNTNETQDVKAMVAEAVTNFLRENFVAIFQQEDEDTLLMQFVGGKKLRISVKNTD
jgi:hypothetical protein